MPGLRHGTCGVFWALACLGILGCGLQDYHARMDAVRARLKSFDEEEKSLGLPVQMPTARDKDGTPHPGWPFDIFIRPPQGTADAVPGEGAYSFGDLTLYRYPGKEGHAFFLAAAPVLEKDKKTAKESMTADDFRSAVASALAEYGRTTYKTGLTIPSTNKPVRETKTPPAAPGEKVEPVAFDVLEVNDPSGQKEAAHFFLYFHQKGPRQVAIVYQVPEKTKNDRQAINASLQTLDITNAEAKRQQFRR